MATAKLYWSDPFATTFEGATARLGHLGERRTLVLDRTLFYPESGGQLPDVGTLVVGDRTLRIEDVQVDDEGTIHHASTEPLEELVEGGAFGATPYLTGGKALPARGAIDGGRRLDHMAQHTAQHALSRALVDVAGAETISSRLGATCCTIDVDGSLSERDLARAEDCVHSIVMSDVVVRSFFPSAEELARMPLRRAPKVDHDVRIIEIEGFDLTPCGGTHCTRTGQMGLVRVVGLEKYKTGWRISFHAGRRALDDVRRKDAVLADLARDLTCGLLDVGGAVGKLRADLKARTDALSTTRGELVELLADGALAAHPPDPSGSTHVLLIREQGDVGMLRTLAGRLAARGDVVAFCASPERGSGEWSIVVQRGGAAHFDCGRWLKEVAAAHGGRGGGRPDRAEGRLPAGAPIAELVGNGARQG